MATTALLALALIACDTSDDGLSYTAPDNICGIPADKKVLEALLDDGNKFEQSTGHFSLQEGQFCHMYVDENDSVISDAAWHQNRYKLSDYFLTYDVKGLRYLREGEFASWNNGVVALIQCPGVSEKGDVLTVEVSDMRWNEKSQELLEKLAPSYFNAYEEKLGCRS
ncbi:hypothetical protein [Streptomyces sp. WG7]|uniref:hypothetical protein n=1 Tax=Streptomyces sp. WG7 TaxID=3417650 RepID=UPI003CEC16CC